MKKNILFWISAVILIALIFAVFGCKLTKEQRKDKRLKAHAMKHYKKALEIYPALIDSVTTTDTVIIVDSVTIHSTNTIRTTEIDSIIVDCPDEVKPKIREQIKSRCTIESILGKPRLVNDIGGHHILTGRGDDISVYCSRKQIHTETINYIPNEKCERQCEEDKKRMEKEHRYQMIKLNLFCIVIGYVLNFVVRVIRKSGGLR